MSASASSTGRGRIDDSRSLFGYPCWTLLRREITRFLRQRSRVIGALGMPLVFWFLAGSMFGGSIQLPGVDSGSYLRYTFPGAIGSILLFTAIFSTISIIDDRREGFMQGVLVSPASRTAIVLGKVLGATILAVGQAVLFLLLGPLAGIPLSVVSFIATVGAMVLVAFGTTSLGFWIAWRMESTQAFHAIMNLVLLPMLLLSGAFAPPENSWAIVRWLTFVNPMTYGLSTLRIALGIHVPESTPSWPVCLLITLVSSAVVFVLAIRGATVEGDRALA